MSFETNQKVTVGPFPIIIETTFDKFKWEFYAVILIIVIIVYKSYHDNDYYKLSVYFFRNFGRQKKSRIFSQT